MLSVRNLSFAVGAKTILDDVSVDFAAEKITAILGANGSGKSTLMSFLGKNRAAPGHVFFCGEDISEISPHAYALKAAMLPQQRETIADFAVEDVVVMGRFPYKRQFRDYTQADYEIARTAMREVGIEAMAKRRIGSMSGGEIQRVRLALALLAQPELLVLDEPTTGMDPTARAAFWDMMRRETEQGRAILFATHYLQEAADFADRIIIIDRGRLVAEGSVDEVRALGEGTTVTATWPGLSGEAELRAALAPVSGSLLGVEVHGSHLELRTSAPDDVARLLLTATPSGHIGVMALSLEEIFTELVGEEHDGAPDAATAPAL